MSEKLVRRIAWILALMPLLGWNLSGIMDLDEGFYGAIAAEMNRRGDWLIPYYNGHPWFEKPILIYWLAKPAIAAFGVWWGPRIPSVLATIGTLYLVQWQTDRRIGRLAGTLSLLILGTSLWFMAVGRYLLCDPLLICTLTGTFMCFWESLHGDPRWRYAAAGFLGLSVLAKGPVGCAIFVAVAAWVFWREKPLRPAFKGAWLGSILIFAAVAASWYLPAYLQSGQEFVQGFIVDQNIRRFQGGDAAHHVGGLLGLIYYIPIVLVGMAPWSYHALRDWPRRSKPDDEESPYKRLLAAWAIAVLLLFTISGSKLPTYCLPAFPPLAVLAALSVAKRKGDLSRNRLIGFAAGSVALCLVLNGVFVWYWRASGEASAQAMALYVKAHAAPGDAFVEFDMSGPRPKTTNLLHKGDAPGPLPVNATSLPSLLMYANRTCLFIDDKPTLDSLTGRAWVIARSGALDDPGESLQRRLVRVPGQSGMGYVLYQLSPLTLMR